MLMSNQPVIKCWNCLKQKILFTLKFNVMLVQSSLISWEVQCWIWTMVIILSIYWNRMTIFKFRPNSGVAQIFHKQLQTISREFHGSGRLEGQGKCVLKDICPYSNCNPWRGKKRKVDILTSCAQSDSSGKILNVYWISMSQEQKWDNPAKAVLLVCSQGLSRWAVLVPSSLVNTWLADWEDRAGRWENHQCSGGCLVSLLPQNPVCLGRDFHRTMLPYQLVWAPSRAGVHTPPGVLHVVFISPDLKCDLGNLQN